METAEPDNISVITPLNEAIEKTKEILFRPFNMNKWFILGFCAWLSQIGSSMPHFNFNNSNMKESLNQGMEKMSPYMIGGIIGLIVLFVLIGLTMGLLLLWVRSRGKFMFIDCIVHNKAEVSEPWRCFKDSGNSLFWFTLACSLLFFLSMVLAALISLAISFPSLTAKTFGVSAVIAIVVGVLLFFSLVGVWSLFYLYLNDFIVPMMYMKGTRAKETASIFWVLFKGYAGKFILYFLFKIVIGIGIGVIAVLAVCCTCCIAALPYIGAVILLPIYVFVRSYSLCFLRQFGSEFDAWNKAEIVQVEP